MTQADKSFEMARPERPLRPIGDDDLFWDIARSVDIRAADGGWPTRALGVIVARPHPTGWFISGVHCSELPADEVTHFAEFVCVRVYLLLKFGPRPGVWEPTAVEGAWQASSDAVSPEQVADLMDTVPADWR